MSMTQAPILIVDNDADNRSLFRRLMEFSGFAVVEAADGLEALDLAREIQPQLILLDLYMPFMDGWEVARQIRGDSQLAHIPIIAISASTASNARARALAAGCDDFILKPVDVQDVMARVFTHLQLELA